MTSVRTPKPMNADRIVEIAAVNETTIDRNAIASTRNVTPTTYSRKIGSRCMIRSAMSMNAAFRPDT